MPRPIDTLLPLLRDRPAWPSHVRYLAAAGRRPRWFGRVPVLLVLMGCGPKAEADKAETAEPDDSADTSDTVDTADSADSTDSEDSTDSGDSADSGDTADSADTADSGDTAPPYDRARGTYTSNAKVPRLSLGAAPTVTRLGDLDGDGADELWIAVADADGADLVSPTLYGKTGLVRRHFRSYATRPTACAIPSADGRTATLVVQAEEALWTFAVLPAGDFSTMDADDGPLVGYPDLACPGDLTGDGVDDLAAFPTSGDELHVYAGPLDGGAFPAPWAEVVSVAPSTPIGDLDGDGSLDFAAVDSDAAYRVFLGPIPPGASRRSELPSTSLSATSDDWARPTLLGFAAGPPGRPGTLLTTADDGMTITLYTDLVAGEEDRGPTARIYPAYTVTGFVPGYQGDARDEVGVAFAYTEGDRVDRVALFDTMPTYTVPLEVAEVEVTDAGLLAVGDFGGGAVADLVVTDGYGTIWFWAGFREERGADADRDGAVDDCNDEDPAIHPYAVEVLPGVDDDCDGEVDEAGPVVFAPSDAPVLVGPADSHLGYTAAAWDADGDGVDEVVTEYLYDDDWQLLVAAPTATLADALADLHYRGEELDYVPLTGADGTATLLASDGFREHWLLTGLPSGTGELADSAGVVDLAGVPDYAGLPAPAGDVDGDGLDDVWFGGSDGASEQTLNPSFRLFPGSAVGADLGEADALATFSFDKLGPGVFIIRGVGDVTGDGYVDALASTEQDDTVVFAGPLAGELDWSDAVTTLGFSATAAIASDLDTDGAPELWTVSGDDAYVFHTPLPSGGLDHVDADASVLGSDYFGEVDVVAATYGAAETVILASPYYQGGVVDGGRAYAFEHLPSGTVQVSDAADWLVEPPRAYMFLGISAAVLQTGGAPLLALGASGWDAADVDNGAMFVVSGW